ncbi:putative invertase inhibitor [Tripterygium wilfordii]|uniref:Putative invertase inhibitor n=1 Tax=Tripterygium wilfordii TaxID=458696 RepID=A0A7J7DSX3_TRIWF|nr:putative invertase inhibitor [Tripterygium wilfordii]
MNVKAGRKAPTIKLVEEVCSGSFDISSICKQTLLSDPRTSATHNLLSLAKIGLELAITNSTGTRDQIKDMLKNNPNPGKMRTALESCANAYEGIVSSFEGALNELSQGEMQGANYDAFITSDGADYCDKALALAGAKVDSISTANQITINFSKIGYLVTAPLM